jgi:dienelactone hydrolase
VTNNSDSENVFLQNGKVIRRKVTLPSQGVLIRGWLYLPAESTKANPAIVMANALTAVKEITLPIYAERFAKAGLLP